MRNLLLCSVLLFCGNSFAQELDGSWKLVSENGEKVEGIENIRIYQDDYFAFGSKQIDNNQFIKAGGGEYFTEDGYEEVYDFHTADPDLVGETVEYDLQLTDDTLILSEPDKEQVWKKIPAEPADLDGNWVITGRMRDGEMNSMTPGARRTIKILGGGRFQWVAFNSDTKEFHGTGGGTYSAEDGKYVENIKFFSRDASRVGANLDFNYKLEDGKWHHSGKSSKGDPLYEVWSPYQEAYHEN